jgi:hypothetical protein
MLSKAARLVFGDPVPGPCPSKTDRALLALLDMEESVKETNLGKVLGHLQAQIEELQERPTRPKSKMSTVSECPGCGCDLFIEVDTNKEYMMVAKHSPKDKDGR